MPNHIVGSNYSIAQLRAAFSADPPSDTDPQYLLCKGDEILALCLRHKHNPEPGEVWIGNDPAAAEWGRKLAALKDKKTVPLYRAAPSRSFYEFKGHHLITGETDNPRELSKRKAPAPLSRVVFVHPVPSTTL
jgi:hypothetical protein